jgi:hypothetical protein
MIVKTLTLDHVTLLASTGRACDIDALMQRLDDHASFVECKLIDYALGLVEGREGRQRIYHYLFAGNPMQRNYAALFFKRRGAMEILAEAVTAGAIDTVQAYAR